ncbi:TPA: hypothetical protein ACH3X1_006191 [Trebouxia sp. C0004]
MSHKLCCRHCSEGLTYCQARQGQALHRQPASTTCKNDKISTVEDGTTPESAMSRGGLQTKHSVAPGALRSPAEGSKAGGGAAAALLAVRESSNEHHLLQMMQQPNRYEGAGTRAKAHRPEQADKSAKKSSNQAVKEKAGPSAAGKMGSKASSLSAHQPNAQASKGGRPRKEATQAGRTGSRPASARKKAVIDESDTDPGDVDDPESYSSQGRMRWPRRSNLVYSSQQQPWA